MRDIRGDLRDRVNLLEGQINAELARYEGLIAKLKAERDIKVMDLKAKHEAINRLTEMAAWQQNARTVVAAALVATGALTEALVGGNPTESSKASKR
jgi:hypothetical protein